MDHFAAGDSSPVEMPATRSPRRPGTLLVLLSLTLIVVGTFGLVHWWDYLSGTVRINHLYYLGHQGEWDEVTRRLSLVPPAARRSPRYTCMQMEAFLHQARLAEALRLIQAEPLKYLAKDDRRQMPFDRLAGFALLMTGQDALAMARFLRHGADPLCRELAGLVRDVVEGSEADPSKGGAAEILIVEDMIYPDHYLETVRYLRGRIALEAGREQDAVRYLEEACQGFPHQAPFHHALARACLAEGHLDRALVHLRIASLEIQNEKRHGYTEHDVVEFEGEVALEVLPLARRREMSDFWRFLRDLRRVVPDDRIRPRLVQNSRPSGLADLWEWSRLFEVYAGEDWTSYREESLSEHCQRVLAGLESVTRGEIAANGVVSLQNEMGAEGGLDLFAKGVRLKETALHRTGENISMTVPIPSENMRDAAVLFRLRGSSRQGVGPGCEVRLGPDQYRIAPGDEWKWYAIPAPKVAPGDVRLSFTLNGDYVPGYTDLADREDRNLYISNVMLCYLR